MVSFKQASGYAVCIEFTSSAIRMNDNANYYSSTFFMTNISSKTALRNFYMIVCCILSAMYIKATPNGSSIMYEVW